MAGMLDPQRVLGLLGDADAPGMLNGRPNNWRSSVGKGREDPMDFWSRLRALAFGDAPSLPQQQAALDALPAGPEKDAARLEMANNMVGGFAGAIKGVGGHLPMDQASRMARAREMGFDTERPVYHGTNQPIAEFSNERGGMTTATTMGREGIFGASSPEVAGAYADMAANRNIYDIANHEKTIARLKSQSDRLERIANRTQKNEDWDKYYRAMEEWESAELMPMRAEPTGANIIKGFARMERPVEYDAGGGTLLDLARNSGFDNLTEMMQHAKTNGYDGMRLRNLRDAPGEANLIASDHTVVFDPKNIRSVHAKFDPVKRDSSDLLASVGAGVAGAGLLGAGGAAQAADAPAPQPPPAPRPAWAEGFTEEEYQRALAGMRRLPPMPEVRSNQHSVLDIPYPRFGNGGLL